jgi:hypothetical protein
MRHRMSRPTAAALLLGVASALGWAGPGWTQPCGGSPCRPVTSSVELFLDGTLELPLATDPMSYDYIPLTGYVHVVTHATPAATGGFDVRALVNLHDVKGVGTVTGTPYVAVGAVRFEATGVTALEFTPAFALEPLAPPDPITPPEPILPLRVSLSFGTDGTLLEPTVGIHVP